MKSKFCILFAGPIGSSKSPIANYLSYKLNIPNYNTDIINSEVKEDLFKQDKAEFEKRRTERLDEILKMGISFIFDSSIDRKATKLFEKLNNYNYQTFIISIDISKGFLIKLYEIKDYSESLKYIDLNMDEHAQFIEKYSDKINLIITDENFLNRLELSCLEIKRWLNL